MGDRGRKLVQLACNKPLMSDIIMYDDGTTEVELPLENRNPASSLQDMYDITSSSLKNCSANLKNPDPASNLHDTHDIAVPLMSPNDDDVISNSSSDLNLTQIDTVLKMKDILEDNFMNTVKSSPNGIAESDPAVPDWSYSSFPKEVVEHVNQFKKNMSECLKEVQANDKRAVKRLSPKAESPVHGECLIACVLKRGGVIENKKINKENLIALVSKFYAKDTKLMKKLEKNVDRCIEMSIRIQDECKLASHLNDCTNDLMASNKHRLMVNYK